MKSFEEKRVMETESRDDLEEKAYRMFGETAKSFDLVEEKLRFIKRHAEKIDESSTKVFVGSFLGNIEEVRNAYAPVKTFFECISKLCMDRQKTVADHGLPYSGIDVKTQADEKAKRAADTEDAEKVSPRADIKWKLEEIARDIPARIQIVKDSIRPMRRRNNDIDFFDGAFASLENLNNSMEKLHKIEEDIIEYSK